LEGPQLAAQIEGYQIWGVGEKFGKPTKMAAYLFPLLEIDFLYPPTKFLYDILFAFPTGVALSHDHVEAMID
jgi:hypothetical protein